MVGPVGIVAAIAIPKLGFTGADSVTVATSDAGIRVVDGIFALLGRLGSPSPPPPSLAITVRPIQRRTHGKWYCVADVV